MTWPSTPAPYNALDLRQRWAWPFVVVNHLNLKLKNQPFVVVNHFEFEIEKPR